MLATTPCSSYLSTDNFHITGKQDHVFLFTLLMMHVSPLVVVEHVNFANSVECDMYLHVVACKSLNMHTLNYIPTCTTKYNLYEISVVTVKATFTYICSEEITELLE